MKAFAVALAAGLLVMVVEAGTARGAPTSNGAAGANVRGRLSGYERLVPEVYADAAKPESRRWTWREPSPSTGLAHRKLSASLSRDVCVVASLASAPAAGTGAAVAADTVPLVVTGGRVVPTTVVVPPGTSLTFRNADPFKHRLYVVGGNTFRADDINPNQTRAWAPPGPGRYEICDELSPTVRTYIIAEPQVVDITYPSRDGSFSFALGPGEYVLRPFFGGKLVGKPQTITVKDRGVVELREPLLVVPSDGKDEKPVTP